MSSKKAKNSNYFLLEVDGNRYLSGAKLQAHDLRGAAALVIAGLASYGKTIITVAEYFLRGYDLDKFPNFLTIN